MGWVESRSRERTAYLTEKRCSRESSGTLFGSPRWASLAMGLNILDPQHFMGVGGQDECKVHSVNLVGSEVV